MIVEQTGRDELVNSIGLKFMRKLTDKHPGVTVEVLGKQPGSTADSWTGLIYQSREELLDIAETQAHLLTGCMWDHGVAIACVRELSDEAWLAEELAP